MLLSGVPVVSTQSLGGRDIWYNNNNSIIVEADPSSVAVGVAILKNKLISGEIKPDTIRKSHIEQTNEHRERFYLDLRTRLPASLSALLMSLLKDSKLYKHKMIEYHRIDCLPDYIIYDPV